MLRAPWRQDLMTKAEFDPVHRGFFDAGGGASLYTLLRGMQRVYASASAPGFAAWRYVRPHGPLYHELEVPGCGGKKVVVPSAAGGVAFTPGSMVSVGTLRTGSVILGRPPGGLIGASAFALEDVDGGAFDDIAVTGSSPELVAGLNDQVLELYGHGFSDVPLDEFTAGVYDDDEASATFGQYLADPFVTLHDPTWISSGTVEILADVLSTCPDGYRFGVTWERG